MLMPLWLCIGTVGYVEPLQLDPPHKAFSHLFPGARDPQTFALAVPASVYKNNEEEGRQRSREKEGKGKQEGPGDPTKAQGNCSFSGSGWGVSWSSSQGH